MNKMKYQKLIGIENVISKKFPVLSNDVYKNSRNVF